MFLIDTMVLSVLRRRARDPGVMAWISSKRHEDCFLSVVSIGEIERGITRKQDGDPAFADQLARWLDQLMRLNSDRLLAVDVGVAPAGASCRPRLATTAPTCSLPPQPWNMGSRW